ncbi:MAG TPA: heme-binding protein [Gemmatimonadales bacterium]|nr:heme-binding protein [Gemmatimonadales bacterium]
MVVALTIVVLGLGRGDVMAQAVEVEQLTYEVLAAVGSIEIRQYGPWLAAETDMGPGSEIEAEQEAAFMTLAAFIFGQNRQGPVVAMTAPVSVTKVTAPIAMTAPVAMEPSERGRVMRFFMPAEYTLETLPRPGDNQVRIVTVLAQTLAVLRFSGEADDEHVAERKAELLAGLAESNWEPVGEPGFFGYDPPMTPPEQRRNEVFVEVAAARSAKSGQQAKHVRPA